MYRNEIDFLYVDITFNNVTEPAHSFQRMCLYILLALHVCD